jgi:CubicO group peptidase (beta-lactamase class C family)
MTRRALILGGAAMALRREKVDEAIGLVNAQVESGAVQAASLHVCQGKQMVDRAFGAAKTPDAVFLLASISKPMTASAVMLLSDRGQLSLEEPVRKYIPEFRGGDKDRVLVKHLLTHTSGLPDMLPENDALRQRHAPLKDFVAGTCATPLLFPPGTQVRYQSMGVLLAGEIVERVTRRGLPEFLREEIYRPLGMKDTSLGLGGRDLRATMQCQVPEHTDWDWNSEYWRNLGSPWGGAHATAADIGRFLRYFVNPEPAVLKRSTVTAMITNQNAGLNQARGIGWDLTRGFGKHSSARTFGHGGSTGTLAWMDPEKDLSFVLLTTKPAAVSNRTLLSPVADVVSESPAP